MLDMTKMCDFDKKIIEKARVTTYKHHSFFIEGTKSVKYAIGYLVDSGFGLRLKKGYRFNHYGYSKLQSNFPFPEDLNSEMEVVEWFAERRIWQPLCLTADFRDGGTDQGKLKILTAIVVMGLPFVDVIEEAEEKKKESELKRTVLEKSYQIICSGYEVEIADTGVSTALRSYSKKARDIVSEWIFDVCPKKVKKWLTENFIEFYESEV